MMNIVVPMAGRGSRFADAGYELPKPLIEIRGHPMIEFVVHNVRPKSGHRFIFICLKEHLDKYGLEKALNKISPGCAVIPVSQVTEGAACTVLLAEKYIDNENPIMIANSDQYVDIDINDYLTAQKNHDGLVMTMKANDNRWSYIKWDDNGFITTIKEKEVISDEATVGIYNYARGSDFVKYAHRMIDKNIRVNNEFYVAPVYNEMIEDGMKLTYYNVGTLDAGMYGLGVPDDLINFLENPLSRVFEG